MIADSECLPISLIMEVQIQIIIIIIEIIVIAMNDDFIIFNLVLINNSQLLKNSQKFFKRNIELEI